MIRNRSGSVRRTEMPTSIGIGEAVHSPSERFAACTVCCLLFSFALLAAKVSLIQGPEIKPILPILATTWALADLMTAFLLLSQFYVNGTTFLTGLGAAYALSGLMTCPYLLAFPNLFYTGHVSIPEQQAQSGSGLYGMPPFRRSSVSVRYGILNLSCAPCREPRAGTRSGSP